MSTRWQQPPALPSTFVVFTPQVTADQPRGKSTGTLCNPSGCHGDSEVESVRRCKKACCWLRGRFVLRLTGGEKVAIKTWNAAKKRMIPLNPVIPHRPLRVMSFTHLADWLLFSRSSPQQSLLPFFSSIRVLFNPSVISFECYCRCAGELCWRGEGRVNDNCGTTHGIDGKPQWWHLSQPYNIWHCCQANQHEFEE